MEGSTRCYETAERSFTYLVRVVTRFHIVVPTNLAVSRCSSRGGAQCSMAAALPCRLYGSKLSAAVELATAIRATSSRSLLPRTAACCNIRQLQTAAGAHSTLHPRSIFVPPISKARSLATSPSARAVEKRPESGRRTLEDLPDKVDVSVGPAGRLSKVIPDYDARWKQLCGHTHLLLDLAPLQRAHCQESARSSRYQSHGAHHQPYPLHLPLSQYYS